MALAQAAGDDLLLVAGAAEPQFDVITRAQRFGDLPILIASGDAEPLAAGGALLQLLGQRYHDAGMADVTVTLYPAAHTNS